MRGGMMPDDFKIIHADGTLIGFNEAKEIRAAAYDVVRPLSYAMMNLAERRLWLALGGSKDHQGEQFEGLTDGQSKG